MPLQYVGKRWMGLAIGVTRSTVHLAAVGVLRDDKTGTIHERLYRPVCRMPSRDPIISIPIQTIGELTPTCKLCKSRISPNTTSNLDEANADLFGKFEGDEEFQRYAADPEQYFASGRGVDESGIFRAKWTDIVTRAELGEVSSYLTAHEVYPEIKRVLTDLPNIPAREFAVVDLLKAYPSERRVLYRVCTAALAMQRMPPGRRRFPVDALFRATKNAKL